MLGQLGHHCLDISTWLQLKDLPMTNYIMFVICMQKLLITEIIKTIRGK